MILKLNSFKDKKVRKKLHDIFEDIMLSGQYAEGRYTKMLESAMAPRAVDTAIAFNSCGSALYVMFRYYRTLGYRSAAVQNNTFYATAAAALQAGMGVTLVDSAHNCPSMGVESLKEAIRRGVDMVCLTHIGGFVAKDYEAIASLCRAHNVLLVEDCAHTLGLDKPGSLGEAACYSLYATKAVPAGEGGVLVTRNKTLALYAERFRQYGKHIVDSRVAYDPCMLGMNLRISEWDAGVAHLQMLRINEIVEARIRDAAKLQSIAPCMLDGESNFYKYPVLSHFAEGYKQTGKVYAISDQLHQALPQNQGVNTVHTLAYSIQWAQSHACLPIGEDFYVNLSGEEVREAVKK